MQTVLSCQFHEVDPKLDSLGCAAKSALKKQDDLAMMVRNLEDTAKKDLVSVIRKSNT